MPLWASARTCEFNAIWEWGMTKNEDVSWIPKPVRCSLKEYSTAELVAELSTRNVEWLKLPQDEKIIFDILFDKIKCKLFVVRE